MADFIDFMKEEEEKEEKREAAAILPMQSFTRKEKIVVIYLLRAKSRKEIAKLMGVSVNTVKTHMRNVYKKTGVHRQRELMSKYLFGYLRGDTVNGD